MSRVDVIIPCYKYAHYLRACVESVLRQPGVEVRVLVIDDASPDDTPEVAAALMTQDARVEYRRHEVNTGHIQVHNEGLEWASGDYVMLLSADDLLAPGALRRAARLMDEHTEVGLVCGRAIRFEIENDLPDIGSAQGDYGARIIPGLRHVAFCCRTGCNNVATPTAVVRTELQKKLGGYRKELPHTGDMEMWMRFAVHGAIGFVDAVQAFYRVHARSMSQTTFGRALADLDQRRKAFDFLFREHGRMIRDAERLHRRAKQALGEEGLGRAQLAFDRGEISCCRELLRFAVDTRPPLRYARGWASSQIKLHLGTRLASLLVPGVDWARRRVRAGVAGTADLVRSGFRPTKQRLDALGGRQGRASGTQAGARACNPYA